MPSLYLSGHNTRARLESRHLVVERADENGVFLPRFRVPLLDVSRATLVGRVRLILNVLHRFLKQGIPVTLATSRGRLLGTISPVHNGSALLRLRQYDMARSPEFSTQIARALVFAKIRNSRRVLQRLVANREQDYPRAREAIARLDPLMAKASSAETLDEIRGYEGVASAIYFQTLSAFFPDDPPFGQRTRRPPMDEANALLSWTYTVALSEVILAVQGAGLDVCLGFLHGIAYGRPSLALDLLEPYRAPLCDLLVLHMFNHRILKKENFERSLTDGGVRLRPDARKNFFLQYERTMERLFSREKGGPHTTFRQCIRDDVYRLIHAMQKGQKFQPFFMP